jgi:hypothetical protein
MKAFRHGTVNNQIPGRRLFWPEAMLRIMEQGHVTK